MDGRIVVSIMLPATGRRYEFRVPLHVTVGHAVALIADILAVREPDAYENTGEGDVAIVDEGPYHGRFLNPSETFEALCDQGVICDGARLVLL